jgi:alpha-amylase/alpha-mannosidase (GH57 family)
MKLTSRVLSLLLTIVLLVNACTFRFNTPETPTTVVTPDLYLQIIWDQHQPFYAVDPDSGLVSAPWVRLHAARDYVDMVGILKSYPNIHLTFNLTPSLLRQIEDFNSGVRDIAWALTETPADQLTDEQKTLILQRFFDIDGASLSRFPRYLELQQKRAGTDEAAISAAVASWSAQDFLDLQTLFNLAWIDAEYLAQQPLLGLVEKGRDFSEEDKLAVLSIYEDLVSQVVPAHSQLQDTGQIEVTFTPYANPILPLLIDTDLASAAVPEISLPTRFAHSDDAVQQLDRGIALYEQEFGRAPRGMWPAEGSVAQEMIDMVAQAGVRWMLTDEVILARSQNLDLTRSQNGLPANVTALYRPYRVVQDNLPVTIFFRDAALSDRISSEYGRISAQAAVDDFLIRLRALRDELKDRTGGPYVATVALDGDDIWGSYENNGKDFLNILYYNLANDPTIRTVTPSEFLELYAQTPERIPHLWAGSWDNASLEAWIGEEEENRAWEYLGSTRAVLEEYLTGQEQGSVSAESVEQAYQAMLAAEGSEWFWWYGTDQDSGSDPAMDVQFRETLGQVYTALGLQPPAQLNVPIIQPIPVEADLRPLGTLSPTIDGLVTPRTEWEDAGEFQLGGNLTAIKYGFDQNNLSLRGSVASPPDGLEIYLKVPSINTGTPFSTNGGSLDMYATHRIRVSSGTTPLTADLQAWNPASAAWEGIPNSALNFKAGTGIFELSIPLADLSPSLSTGESILLRINDQGSPLPAAAPGRVQVPDLGQTIWFLDLTDPASDDHGPGSYTYPTDAVFMPGVFDLTNFKVGSDENNLVFQATLSGPVVNPWGSPNGLSLQLIDIYIDVNGLYSGTQVLRNARNAAVSDRNKWDFAISIAGWNSGVFAASSPETALDFPVTVFTDPDNNLVIARIPLTALPGDPSQWAYSALILAYDPDGLNGVREVSVDGGQWQFGGAPADSNHTRIIDYLWPEGLESGQESMLSGYQPSQADPSGLSAPDLPRLEMYSMP